MTETAILDSSFWLLFIISAFIDQFAVSRTFLYIILYIHVHKSMYFFLAQICRAHLTEGISNNAVSVFSVREHYTFGWVRNLLFYYSPNRVMR